MCVGIDRRAAGVETQVAGFEQGYGFYPAGERVVKPRRGIGHTAALASRRGDELHAAVIPGLCAKVPP